MPGKTRYFIKVKYYGYWASQVVQCLPVHKMRVHFLSREDPLEKGMATQSSILAWRIPWTGEPGRLPSMGLQRVGHN